MDMSLSRSKSSYKKVPDWAREPFNRFRLEVERLGQIIEIAAKGIGMFRATPEIIELLTEIDKLEKGSVPEENNELEDDRKKELEDAREKAELAKHEVETGFPVLHAWAVVGLWALLESMIRTFAAQWIKHKRSAWQSEPIRSIKIKIGEYEAVPKEQRHLYVAEILEREIGVGAKRGISRFENMLEVFGLSGEIPEGLGKTIYEFCQVRNLMAHSASMVDRRFINDCPWIGVKVGEKLCVNSEMFGRYSFAAVAYVLLIRYRVGEHYGVDMSKNMISLEKDIASILGNKL